MLRRILAIGLALLAALSAVPALAQWRKAETRHFTIYSAGKESDLRDLAIKLERFDAALRLAFRKGDPEGQQPLPIYLLPKAKDVSVLNGDTSGFTGGFYVPDPEGAYAVSNRENMSASDGSAPAQLILFHEYAHHFMFRNMPRATPTWYVEGFAEFFSTLRFNKQGGAELGRPVVQRAYGLHQLPQIPVNVILAGKPRNATAAEMEVFYGRSWLLTHMLGFSPTRGKQLTAYLNAFSAGVPPMTAAKTHFGDLDVLNKELNDYVAKNMNYGGKMLYATLPPMEVNTDVRISLLSEADGSVILPRLRRLNARSDSERSAAFAELAALSTTFPDSVAVWYEYAKAGWDVDKDARDLSTITSAISRVLALDPDHGGANILQSHLLLDAAYDNPDATDSDWQAAREPIARALRAQPNDAVALAAQYRSYEREGRHPPAEVRAGLARAFALAPEVLDFRAAYAIDLVQQGQFDTAIALIRTIAYSPHDNGQGQALLDQITAMRDRAKGTVSGKDEVEAAGE